MPKFAILDNLLTFVGGHYFEYDVNVLQAAERQGWRPVLGAHQNLGDQRELDPSWEIYRAFRIDYNEYLSIMRKLGCTEQRRAAAQHASKLSRLAGHGRYRFDRRRYQRRYARLKHSYAAALDEIWSGCRPARGDQMFLPSATPLDVAGLAAWAGNNRSAREVDWHLQFHSSLVDTETWYAGGSRKFDHLLTEVLEPLQDLMRMLPRDQVHFYATTQPLAGQLEYCLGEPFQTLPVPINPALTRLRAAGRGRKPLRAIFAGQPQATKGTQHWPRMISALRDDYFATGRLQLAFQAESYDVLPEPLRKLAVDLASPADGQAGQAPIALARWPLSPADYVEYLTSSDIGLFMHDPVAYHVRISGVMGELLGVGLPVVAPAGCALADQIAEPIFAYQEQLRERLPVVANRTTAELDWKLTAENAAERGIRVGTDAPCATAPAAVARTAVPAHASHLLVLLARDEPNPWNRYSAVSVEQQDAAGQPGERSRDVIGYRGQGRWMTVLVPLGTDCRQIEIRLQTAHGHEPFLLRRMECCFLAAPEPSQLPIGAVGRLASDPGQAAECLREVVDHYDHYETTARALAATWAPAHTADQVLRDLTARTVDGRRAAA